MPLKMWDSPTVECAPLSEPSNQEEDDEENFVPYSDRPAASVSNNTSNGGEGIKSIMVEEDDEPKQRKSEYSDDYRDDTSYEDEYGDLSYTNRTFANTPKRHYRSSLICAYLRHCLENRVIRRLCSMLFFLTMMLIMIFCASAIGYIISQDGNPFSYDGSDVDSGNIPKFVPPSPNLHNICSDWVTVSGRKNCQSYCDKAKCCSLPETDKDSCWKEHTDDCATYRSACMALEAHNSVANVGASTNTQSNSSSGIGSLSSVVDLPPPPTNLIAACSTASLSTPYGFQKCSDICRPSRCCNSGIYNCQLKEESSRDYCFEYEAPCKSVAETWRGSGNGEGSLVANQVIIKCNVAK